MSKKVKQLSPVELAKLRAERGAIDADLITIVQLSARLNVSLRTIRYWDKKGLLPPRTRWGRYLKYSLRTLDEWQVSGKLGTAR
jgi:DNA-binding transcriptional regulator YiaG